VSPPVCDLCAQLLADGWYRLRNLSICGDCGRQFQARAARPRWPRVLAAGLAGAAAGYAFLDVPGLAFGLLAAVAAALLGGGPPPEGPFPLGPTVAPPGSGQV
jgi:hypothetical protein